jgi:hypothetical protein
MGATPPLALQKAKPKFYLFIYLEKGALLAPFEQQMVFYIEDLQHRQTVRRGGVSFWLGLFSVVAGMDSWIQWTASVAHVQ